MTTDAPARTKRPERPQAILTVTATEAVTPNLIRITAGGEGFDAIKDNDATDKYVKIIFADPRHGLTPPYDLAALREHSPERRRATARTRCARWTGRIGTDDRLRRPRRRGHRRPVGADRGPG